MKIVYKNLLMIGLLTVVSCGGKDKKKEKEPIRLRNNDKEVVVKQNANPPEADLIDMSNKGIGPVKNVTLAPDIDQAMVTQGQEIYQSKCTACHKPDKRFIGPAPTGILERRSPEWIMNMILNPTEMTKNDPIAKQLLIEFNGSPMANQGLTQEEARKVLEYFRTLK